jgi:hypothetical protein
MYPHRIRLRGPWECEPLARLVRRANGELEAVAGPLPAARRLTMPAPWRTGDLSDFTGRVRFRRRFGYPGQIDSYERVWLTCAGVNEPAEVWLNERLLGRPEPGAFEHEITSVLARRNCLEITLDALSLTASTLGEVAMEVRCTAFLRGVRAWRDAPDTLQVRGEVVGFADRPLEVYVLGDRQTLAYGQVEAGRSFQLTANLERSEVSGLRVDLVNLSTIWYSVELPVP